MQVSDEVDVLIDGLTSGDTVRCPLPREPYWSPSLRVGSQVTGDAPTIDSGGGADGRSRLGSCCPVIHVDARKSVISGPAAWSCTMNRCPPS